MYVCMYACPLVRSYKLKYANVCMHVYLCLNISLTRDSTRLHIYLHAHVFVHVCQRGALQMKLYDPAIS